jgi:hypothetical protein
MIFPRLRDVVDMEAITENMAELFGWYLAEGCSTKEENINNTRTYHVEFSFGKHEKEHVVRVISLLKECFGYEALSIEKETAIVINFTSLIWGKLFSEFGSCAEKKQIPLWALKLPAKKQFKMLKSMIQGDGDVTKESIRYSTVSERLAYELRLMLFRLGILHGIHRSKKDNGQIKGRKFMVSPSYMFTIGGESANILARETNLPFKSKASSSNWGWVTEKYILIPIRRTEREDYDGIVCNLHVPPNESYVTLHGILHNCVEGHTMKSMTELRHAIDRFRTAGEINEGVAQKVRVAIGELMGIDEDVKNVESAPAEVKEGLTKILDRARWIRKEYGVGGKGLTAGLGELKDLEALRNEVGDLQVEAYQLIKKCPMCLRKLS